MASRRIVVGIDGSPNSDHALQWAVADARSRQADLEVVLVWDVGWLNSPHGALGALDVADSYEQLGLVAAARVDAAIAALRENVDTDGVYIAGHEARGPVVQTLLGQASDADELIVGRRGLSRLSRIFMGSVSTGVARAATIPVTIIPDQERVAQQRDNAADGSELDETPRVVVGVDGSEASIAAIQFAADHARRHNLPLHAVTAWQFASTGALPESQGWIPPIDDYETHARKILDQSIRKADVDAPDDRVVRQVLRGTPARAILRAAAGATHLVLGSRGLGGFERLMLGSVSSQLVEHAPCPVTVVRS